MSIPLTTYYLEFSPLFLDKENSTKLVILDILTSLCVSISQRLGGYIDKPKFNGPKPPLKGPFQFI